MGSQWEQLGGNTHLISNTKNEVHELFLRRRKTVGGSKDRSD